MTAQYTVYTFDFSDVSERVFNVTATLFDSVSVYDRLTKYALYTACFLIVYSEPVEILSDIGYVSIIR